MKCKHLHRKFHFGLFFFLILNKNFNVLVYINNTLFPQRRNNNFKPKFQESATIKKMFLKKVKKIKTHVKRYDKSTL